MVLVAAARGGDGESSGSAHSGSVIDTSDDVVPAPDGATAALVAFGDLTTAGVAVLIAYDTGFTYDQIATAIAGGTLAADGTIAGGEPEESLGGFQPVGFRAGRPLPRDLDIDLLSEELAAAAGEFGTVGIKDAPQFFLELILHAARDGYPVDVIVEAIVLGDFTDATWAEMEARSRELLREELRDELEYCRMRGAMSVYTGFALSYEQCVLDQTGQTVDELYGPESDDDDPLDEVAEDDDGPVSVGTGGLGGNPVIPGPEGTMTSESVTLTIDGDTASLAFDIAFTTAVEYVDEAPVCFDDFTFTSGASDLTVDGATVTGTTELILNFDGATQCSDTEQDDIGVPQTVDVTGEIDDGGFLGELSFTGLVIPFAATVG